MMHVCICFMYAYIHTLYYTHTYNELHAHLCLDVGVIIIIFKNTKNLFIHIARIPIGDSP